MSWKGKFVIFTIAALLVGVSFFNLNRSSAQQTSTNPTPTPTPEVIEEEEETLKIDTEVVNVLFYRAGQKPPADDGSETGRRASSRKRSAAGNRRFQPSGRFADKPCDFNRYERLAGTHSAGRKIGGEIVYRFGRQSRKRRSFDYFIHGRNHARTGNDQ